MGIAQQPSIPGNCARNVALLHIHVERVHVNEEILAFRHADHVRRLVERVHHVALVAVHRFEAQADAQFASPMAELAEAFGDPLALVIRGGAA